MAKQTYVYDGSTWVEIGASTAIPSASTSAAGVVQLTDSTSTTSSILAATATAVKNTYDFATTKPSVYYQPTAPASGNDGDIWIDSDDETVTAAGPQGPAGATGATGPAGQNAYNVPIITQATSRDIALTDLGDLIECTSATAMTLTVRSDSTVTGFTNGDQIMILQAGAGQVTIAGNGATINGTPGLKLRAQWSSATLIKRGTNLWVLVGDTAP